MKKPIDPLNIEGYLWEHDENDEVMLEFTRWLGDQA